MASKLAAEAQAKPAVVIQPGAKIYTVDDYLALTDEYPRYELLDGELIEMVSPTSRHQRILLNLYRRLDDHVRTQHLGEIFLAPLDVILARRVVVQPDLIFIAEARRKELIQEPIVGAPDLVIEILSPTSSQRDLNQKRKLYARHGVQEYWIVDPDDSSLEIQRLQGKIFSTVGWFEKGQTLTSPTFPGLELDVAQVFAE
jgi:Uma2 family endonuclease